MAFAHPKAKVPRGVPVRTASTASTIPQWGFSTRARNACLYWWTHPQLGKDFTLGGDELAHARKVISADAEVECGRTTLRIRARSGGGGSALDQHWKR